MLSHLYLWNNVYNGGCELRLLFISAYTSNQWNGNYLFEKIKLCFFISIYPNSQSNIKYLFKQIKFFFLF
jgi:hypothetical protein